MQPPSWLGTVYNSIMSQQNSSICRFCPCYNNSYDMERQEQVNDPTTDSKPAPVDCTREVGRLQCGCCVLSVKVILRVWGSHPVVGLGITSGESSTFVTRYFVNWSTN